MTAICQTRVTESYARTFDKLDDLQNALAFIDYSAKANSAETFNVRLACARLNSVAILSLEEASCTETLLTTPKDCALVVLPIRPGSRHYWGGIETKSNDIVFGWPGEMLSHRTTGKCLWGCALLSYNDLVYWCRAISGRANLPPTHLDRVRMRPAVSNQLRKVAIEACQLVEQYPAIFSHAEVQKSLEQEFILALVNALSASA